MNEPRPDLLEYLFIEYRKKLDEQEQELTEEAEAMFKSFIDFCHYQLKINPAVSVFPLEQGLGLKLSNATEVPLVTLPSLETAFFGSMPITDPKIFPANNGVNDVRCVPIFGKDQ